MTESFGPYCGERLDRDLPEAKVGSCGRPFADIEVRIVDPDTGAAVEAGAVGEIQIRGRNLMRGICGKERSEVFTADGFYPTGDLGALDADGYLFFRGRRDDMFKVKGASVYPSEVEAALVAIPEIEKAFVVDVAQDREGQDGAGDDARAVGAVVVLSRDAECSVDQLEAATRARLSAFKVPVRWSLIAADEVPVTATGKVDQPAIRRLLGDTA